MFAALGYVPLSQLFRFRVPPEVMAALSGDIDGLFRGADGGKLLQHLTPQDLIEHMMLGAVRDGAVLCSPQGQVMRVDLQWLREVGSYSEMSLFDIERASKENPECPRLPEEVIEALCLSTYPYEDLITAAAKSEKTVFEVAKELGTIVQHLQIPFYYERQGYTLSFRALDFIARQMPFIDTREVMSVARTLLPFEGWSLCVTEQFAGEQWLKTIKAALPISTVGRVTTIGGRPATVRRDSKAAYNRLYPNGHERKPWLQVLRDVNAATGHDASVDTLKRALRESPTAKPAA